MDKESKIIVQTQLINLEKNYGKKAANEIGKNIIANCTPGIKIKFK